MKRALVIGASGGMGYALTCELIARNIEVAAFARSEERLTSIFKNRSKVVIIPGNALNESELLKAAENVDVIFNAISFPYHEWEEKHLRCIDNIISVAKRHGAKIALVDNVYAYGIQTTQLITEEAIKNPHTIKGKIRLEMEDKLKKSGVHSIIVHLPDLYGPHAINTILYSLLQAIVQKKKVNFVGNMSIAREYIYTFDAAKAMVELALRDDTYNQNWNIPSCHPITGDELITILSNITNTKINARAVEKGMIRFLSIFSKFMREYLEMYYLTEIPAILSGEKYEKVMGSLPRTPYQKGLQETIDLLLENNNW